MIRYILRRILVSIPLLMGMSFITFMFIQAAPGNYFDSLRLNPEISPATIAQYEAQYQLDKPPLVQYAAWLGRLARGDMGYSFAFRAPVTAVIASRAGNTLLLTLVALVATWLLALPLGVWQAVRRGKPADRALSFASFVGMSVPTFFTALLALVFASRTGLLPVGGIRSVGFERLDAWQQALDVARHLIIPAGVITLASLASLTRVIRGNLLEVLQAPYIVAARARGLPESRVLTRHALRNAINPMITIFGYELSGLLSGAALTEIICNWPGLGSLMLLAVRQQDLFLVMGNMLMGGLLLLAGNLFADVGLALADPRIRYARR